MSEPKAESRRSLLLVWVVFGVVALAVTLVVTFGDRSKGPDPAEHPAIGRRLPDFALQPLTGLAADAQPVKATDLIGQVTLLNFWGTWCPPCAVELPHIHRLWEKHRENEDFQLYAVSSGTTGDADLEELREATAQFLEEMTIDLPTYADRLQYTRYAAAKAEAFSGYPTTVVLDRQGVIRGVWEGYRPGVEVQMDRLVTDLLQEPGSPES